MPEAARFALAMLLLAPALGSAAPLPLPLPCQFSELLPGGPECYEPPDFPGSPLRVLPFQDGRGAHSFRLEATEPDSKVWFYIEVDAWDAPFYASVWRPGGGGAGVGGFAPSAEVHAEAFGAEAPQVEASFGSSAFWVGIGWTLDPGEYVVNAAAAAAGTLTGRFRVHDEQGIRVVAERHDGTSDFRQLRDFSPAAQAFAGVPLALGAGVGAGLFASTTVDVRHQLFATAEAFSVPAHAGWWGVEQPDGTVGQAPCAQFVLVGFGGCGAGVQEGAPGRWRFFAHVDVGIGVFHAEPALFLADLPRV